MSVCIHICRCYVVSLLMPTTPLSCDISPCALFAEPRVGKVRTGKLEENLKSRGNCRHVYFLWAGKAVIAADMT